MSRIRKAITAAFTGGVAAFVAAYPDGVTLNEIGVIIGAIVVAGLATYNIPNDITPDSTVYHG